MGKLTFILGGVRSGKSDFAFKLAQKSAKKITFIATALPTDLEMKERIEKHKNKRPKDWKTIEEVTSGLDKEISKIRNGAILIDCLTIYISHLMDRNPNDILKHIEKIIAAIKKSESEVIVISNEVGCGVHPATKLGRDYRDILGKVNQLFAREADEFYVMFAGIPLNISRAEMLAEEHLGGKILLRQGFGGQVRRHLRGGGIGEQESLER